VTAIVKLGRRKSRILREIVRYYVREGRPVGSRQVAAAAFRNRVSSATVRNEMAELERMGLLSQPHTSAGRVPTDAGYRFYVDNLMTRRPIPRPQRARIEERYRKLLDEVDDILRETSNLLAELAGYPAVVVGPQNPVHLRHLHASPVNSHHILVVWVTDDGRIQHRLIQAPAQVTGRQLELISEVLTNRLSNVEISAISRLEARELLKQLPPRLKVPPEVLQHICDSIDVQERGSVFVDGALYILRQPEFADVNRARVVMEALSQKPLVRQVFRSTTQERPLNVTIGSETPFPQLRECSVVSHQFKVGVASGTIGIVGPTRMPYSQTVSIVTFVADRLARSLMRAQSI